MQVNKKMIAVTFDLWQTLLLEDPELGRARANLRISGAQEELSAQGYQFSKDRIHEAYRRCYRICRYVRSTGLDVDFSEQVRIFIDEIQDNLSGKLTPKSTRAIYSAYADSFFVHPPPIHPDAVSVLKSVHQYGYRIGLISNTGMTPGTVFRTYMNQLGILKYFDVLTFSDEVKLSKPDTRIFQHTLLALGVEPNQTIHVGDHLKNDVKGAQDSGLRTIWIEGFDSAAVDKDRPPDAIAPSLREVALTIENVAVQ